MIRGLKINGLVMHGIKKATKGAHAEPALSEAETELPSQVRSFLQTQLSNALKHRREIVEEPQRSTLPDIIRATWRGESSLLGASQTLARNLQQTQPGVSSEGLLMVADTTTMDGRAFLLAKIEHEKGTQAQLEANKAGKMVYSMTFLDNLLFTQGSKVYKIGFFPMPSNLDDPLLGFVVDRQNAGLEVASYFREGYLGCSWREEPDVLTQRFTNTVQEWIDERQDPAMRSRYQLALLAELQSSDSTLSVSKFASTHIDAADRDSFTKHASAVLPTANITKSLTLVQSRIASVRWDTSSGTVVIASPAAVQEGVVQVENGDNGLTKLTVTDHLTRTSSQGKYRASNE